MSANKGELFSQVTAQRIKKLWAFCHQVHSTVVTSYYNLQKGYVNIDPIAADSLNIDIEMF